VNIRTIMTTGSATGVVRLVLLALAATGFLAMHGVAATDPVAGHVSPLDAHSMVAPVEPAAAMHDADPAATSEMSSGSGAASHDHDDMAACAFVLLTVLAGVVLHALGIASGGTYASLSTFIWSSRAPPRAPPLPIFLSLCVFRL
jgi:Family of unknown function (DUF6153)